MTIRSGQLVIANNPYEDPRRGESFQRLRRGTPQTDQAADQCIGTLFGTHQNAHSRIRAEEDLYLTQQYLKQMATRDPVTGVANRSMHMLELEAAFESRGDPDDDVSALLRKHPERPMDRR